MTGRRHMVWGAVAVSLVLAVASLGAPGGVRAYRRLSADVELVRQETERLREANARLRLEARRLRGDRRAIEEAVREDLGFIGPHEIIFTLEAR